MLNKYLSLLILVLLNGTVKAQELSARIIINSSRVASTVDKKIFTTLQTQLTDFVNSRKWTSQQYNESERIQCSFYLNLESGSDQDIYKGALIVQAARPVYNTSYQTAVINFQDQDITFKYQEYQPIEFNDNRVQGIDPLKSNLTATIAYYVYLILGMDYDSFAPKGGEIYFQKAQNIVNNAPEGAGISGWRSFDGLRNRYWLSENLSNSRNNIIHDIIYSYYRSGLDKMYDKEEEARNNIIQSLVQLQAFNREYPNSMIVQFLMQTKSDELAGIFKNGSAETKTKALDVLSTLDAANITKYKDAIKP
ncbi:MAG: DUF4835 family protein [Sphingobacteriia bacterium]|nr:DUF4835 family protein [Sphingobacteriia bacterium]